MKIAVSGKGGVGKSTLAAMLCRLAALEGKNVLAVDGDPDANLAFALGMPEAEIASIVPVSQRKELIEESTGAKLKQFGQIFRLNPDVSSVAEKCGYDYQGIKLIVLGAVEKGGSGCACPENVFLRCLLSEIILRRDDFVVCDFEAGIEHLGRGTAKSIDMMIVVVEPTPQSVNTAVSITKYSQDIGVVKIKIAGNKIKTREDREYIMNSLNSADILGYVPYIDEIQGLEKKRIPLIEGLGRENIWYYEEIYKTILAG